MKAPVAESHLLASVPDGPGILAMPPGTIAAAGDSPDGQGVR